MTPLADDLLAAIEDGRSARYDWFSESSPLESLAATLAAMANSDGGTVVLGVVGPTNSIIGVRDARRAVDRLLQAALSVAPPLIIPLPETIIVKERPIVAATVPPGMPHVYGVDGRYLYRDGPNNVALSPREIRRLMIERGEADFETEAVRGASREDLDWGRVKSYVARMGSPSERAMETILIKRGCLVRQRGRLRPTAAGLLLFGREPQNFIRGSDITAVRFAGQAMSDVFSRQDISGTLPDQIRQAETFLVDHLRKTMQLGRQMARQDTFEYPLEAARELVVNAVAHRDYSITGDGIRLFLFSDRMEVTSPGRLPGPVTIENIKDERFSRNPAIVQVLADMGFIERLGYGVDRVIDLMAQQNLKPPTFEETAGGFRVRLFAQAEVAAPAVVAASVAPSDGVPAPLPAPPPASALPAKPDPAAAYITEFTGMYRGIEVNPRQEVAIAYLQKGHTRLTNSELQNLCPDVHPETIRRDLANLVTKNILKKLGQKRGSYYVLNDEIA